MNSDSYKDEFKSWCKFVVSIFILVWQGQNTTIKNNTHTLVSSQWHPQYQSVILFMDEAHFCRDGIRLGWYHLRLLTRTFYVRLPWWKFSLKPICLCYIKIFLFLWDRKCGSLTMMFSYILMYWHSILFTLNFYFWRHLQTIVCNTKVQHLEDLWNRVIEGYNTIRNTSIIRSLYR